MTTTDQIMDNVPMNEKSSSMGNMKGKSPNQLFKSYLAYFKQKYGDTKQPPTFKQFLGWGRNKGFIAKPKVSQNAEGDNQETVESTNILADAAKTNANKIPQGMTRGKWLALGLLFAGIAGFIFALTRPSK